MRVHLVALLCLLPLAACATRRADPPVISAGPPKPGPAAPTEPNRMPSTGPNLTLTGEQPQPLWPGSTAKIHCEGIAIKTLAGAGDAHPGGNGVSMTLVVEGGAAPIRRMVSLRPPGHTSRSHAWFDDTRVTLLDVEDPYEKGARTLLRVERVTDRARPGPTTAVRVMRGQGFDLDDDVRVEFLGNSTKEISRGERPPLRVAVRYLVPGEQPDAGEFNVGSEDRPQSWRWRDYRFTITDHAHDEWMQLAIDRLELAATP